MKASATGLLLVAAAVYLVAKAYEEHGWAGYVRAAAEAGMVGGLADWFAVTALFRRPLGLPIPHTAIIPTRKDALGASLGDFVGTNFLSTQVVRDRLRRAGVAGRVGAWLAQQRNAERVTAELATAARAAAGVLRDEDVQAVLENAVLQRLGTIQVGPPLGRLLGTVVEEKAHHRAVQFGVTALHEWLVANRERVEEIVLAQAPTWSPRFLDERVAARVYGELVKVAGEIRADAEHPARQAIDKFLAQLAEDLRTDPATMARAERVKTSLLERPELGQALRDLAGAARRLVLELIDDPGSELRVRVRDGLRDFGARIGTDAGLRAKLDGWLENAAAYVVENYRDELTRTITDTVERWDGAETARKIELQVGRDLQFIRINGTVVGALAGLAIYTVTQLLF